MELNGKEYDIIASFRGDQSLREVQADKFAMELLMPAKRVREEYGKLVIPVAASLARKFEVPIDVMKKRLDQLELMYI